VRDDSAAVRCDIRVERGAESVSMACGSGLGRVSALAMLQELAPRSRT
jgi:hypothetical protein